MDTFSVLINVKRKIDTFDDDVEVNISSEI